MARRRPDTREATETLEEIQGVFDRLADWVARNPTPSVALVAAILVGSGGVGLYRWQHERAASAASSAVAEVQSDYREAVGVLAESAEPREPGETEKVAEAGGAAEPPETLAPEERRRYAERFAAVADEHAGTAAAVSARLEAGRLWEAAGEREKALEAWRAAVEEAPGESALEALAHVYLAQGLELEERWAEAAAEHERAGEIEANPARAYALADAARCWANAGETQRALAAFDRAEAGAAGEIPVHVAARMRELRARP